MLPYGSVAHEIRAGRLTGLRIQGGVLASTLYIVTRAQSHARPADEASLSAWLLDRAISQTASSQPWLTKALPSGAESAGAMPLHTAAHSS